MRAAPSRQRLGRRVGPPAPLAPGARCTATRSVGACWPQVLGAVEVMRAQHLLALPIEGLDHAFVLRQLRPCELVLAVERLRTARRCARSPLIGLERLDCTRGHIRSGRREWPGRRNSRSSAERLMAGSMNSRTTDSRSSSDSRSCVRHPGCDC